MGRLARTQSGSLSERSVRSSVPARPRFSTDHKVRPQVKSHSFKHPGYSAKPDSSAPRLFNSNRRARKRMRLIALVVMSIIGLGAGWMLGKTVIGPSRINQPQPAVSVQSAIKDKSAVDTTENANDDKSVAKSAGAADLEARADDAPGSQSVSQDANAWQVADLQDDQRRPGRRSAYSGVSQRPLSSANARRGPGMGVVTRPIKAVFKPLKRVNPLRLRLW
jgi:hypothetical protein